MAPGEGARFSRVLRDLSRGAGEEEGPGAAEGLGVVQEGMGVPDRRLSSWCFALSEPATQKI